MKTGQCIHHVGRADGLSKKVRKPGLEITVPVCVKTVSCLLIRVLPSVTSLKMRRPFLSSENKAEITQNTMESDGRV